MSVFPEARPALDVVPAPRRPRPRGVVVGWVLLAVGVIGAVVLGMLPAPYVVERPGPVYDTLGSVASGKDGTQKTTLIQIPDAKTYPTSGALDLLTVNVVGSRQQPLTWVDVALAWFDRTEAVVPIEEIFPEGQTDQQSDAEGALEMKNSQQEAVAAALRDLGYTVPGTVTVSDVQKGSPAEGKLKAGDEILTADGAALEDVTALRAAIRTHGTDSAIELGIRRDGQAQSVSITPALSEPDANGTRVPIVGIVTGATYQYPVKVSIQLQNVGGPSAGMMFALGIIDKLTPGKLTGGEHIAGTGTIDADGDVGAIGGIRQKLYGAQRAGAKWFLAPADNCNEVVGHVPDGLTVYSVKTLSQAVKAVEAIGTGTGRSQLPTCTRP